MINFLDKFLVCDNFFNTNLVNFEFTSFRIAEVKFKIKHRNFFFFTQIKIKKHSDSSMLNLEINKLTILRKKNSEKYAFAEKKIDGQSLSQISHINRTLSTVPLI